MDSITFDNTRIYAANVCLWKNTSCKNCYQIKNLFMSHILERIHTGFLLKQESNVYKTKFAHMEDSTHPSAYQPC